MRGRRAWRGAGPVAVTRFGVFCLALALLAVPGPTNAQDPTEVAFWSMVKESRKAADIKAYLEAYPRGTYAEAARQRLSELERLPAPPPRPPQPQRSPEPASPTPAPYSPPPSAVGVPALTDAQVIREVQERLYNLNYDVGSINGRLTEETRTAIRQWQNNMQRPQKGDMDLEELTVLRNIRLPAIWGAIAFGDRGASAVVWNRGSRQDAVAAARTDCRGRNKGAECKALSAAETACGALGFYMAGGSWGAYAIVRPTLGQATAVALEQCRQQARRPDACGVRITFCADGSHQQ
jgi:peptidoglycan hydrolase-like protein with peptidoglycan-binding domain